MLQYQVTHQFTIYDIYLLLISVNFPNPLSNLFFIITASTESNASPMKNSSDYSQATSPRGHSRKYEKTSLIGLEEESIPLFDPANAFNSSTLEINVENSSTSDSSNSSASKYKVDLMHV